LLHRPVEPGNDSDVGVDPSEIRSDVSGARMSFMS
jgi:hypothetical protein